MSQEESNIQTPEHTNDRPSLFSKLRMGRLALAGAGIETAAVVASILTGDGGTFAAAGAWVDAALVGGALYSAHSQHVNNYPASSTPAVTNFFVKKPESNPSQ